MENETVILDAGHGGDDYGFTLGAFKEKEAMLRITTSLEKKLQEEGIKTFKTRNDDSTLDNMTRLEIIKEISPYQNAILITNHLNPQNKETKIIYSNGLNEGILNKISLEFNKEIFKTKNSILENEEVYEYDIHHNQYYGTSRKLLNDKIKSGKIIVKDIDVNGTEHLKELLGNDTKVVTIFLRVPKEELKHRLENRIDKPSPQEIILRLNRFDYEESRISLYDYVLKNNDLEKTVRIIMTIIENEEKLERLNSKN